MRLPSPRFSFLPAFLLGGLLAFALNGLLVHWVVGTPVRELEVPFDWHLLKKRAAEKHAPPRLFLLGGSSTHFGLSAREFEKELGLPTINYGTHAGAGHYHLERIKEVAQKGDTVLLALEFRHYQVAYSQLAYVYIVSRQPEYYRHLSWPFWARIVLSLDYASLAELTKNALKEPRDFRWDDPIEQSQKDINAWGDQTGHNKPWPEDTRLIQVLASPPEEGIRTKDSLTAFFEWAQKNGVTVLATWPNVLFREEYLEPDSLEFAAKIKAFYQENGIPVIDEYRHALLPKDWFFDTHYHLLYPASLKRSRQLAPLVRPHLPEIPAPSAEQR